MKKNMAATMPPPEPLYRLRATDMRHVNSITFDEYNANLLAATDSGHCFIWDLTTNRLRHKQKLGESLQIVHALKSSSSSILISSSIISQEKSGVIKLWRKKKSTDDDVIIPTTDAYELEAQTTCGGGFCRSLYLPNNGNCLVVPAAAASPDDGDEGIISVLNVATLTASPATTANSLQPSRPQTKKLGQTLCISVVEAQPRTRIAAGYESGAVILWDLTSGHQLDAIHSLREYQTSVVYEARRRWLFCGSVSTGTVQIVSVDDVTGRLTLTCEVTVAGGSPATVTCLRCRPDGRILTVGTTGGQFQLFSVRTLRALVRLREHSENSSVSDVRFSNGAVPFWKCPLMAVSSTDGTITLWDLYNSSGNNPCCGTTG